MLLGNLGAKNGKFGLSLCSLCNHGQGTCFWVSVSLFGTLGQLPSTASITSFPGVSLGLDFQLLLVLGSTQCSLFSSGSSGQLTWHTALNTSDLESQELGGEEIFHSIVTQTQINSLRKQ